MKRKKIKMKIFNLVDKLINYLFILISIYFILFKNKKLGL